MTVLHAHLVVATILIAQGDVEPGEAVTQRDIAAAVRRLASPEFEVRQEATRFLWTAGKTAVPRLQEALQSPVPEVRFRAKSILDDFKYGIFADTPRDVAQLIRRYRDADPMTQQRAWSQLVSRAPVETLLAIIATEENATRQATLQLKLLGRLKTDGEIDLALRYAKQWRADHAELSSTAGFDKFLKSNLSYLLASEQYDDAEEVLERAAKAGADSKPARDLAVYLLLRGKLDDRIASFRDRLDQATEEAPASDDDIAQLALMLRLKGDLEEARAVAERAGEAGEALVQRLLFDSRNWKQLAELKLEADPLANRSIEPLGFKAAYNRLAGNRKVFDETIGVIRQLAENASGNELSYCREALFLNGFTDEALQLLNRDDREQVFKVELMRNNYEAAFKAFNIGLTAEERQKWLQGVVHAAQDRSVISTRRFRIACNTAQLLHSVGEKDEADEMFRRLAEAASRARTGENLRVVAEFELKAGMTDLAFTHAAKAYYKEPNVSVVDVLFRTHKATANVWWNLYEEIDAQESANDRLRKLRKLFFRGDVDEEVLQLLNDGYEAIVQLGEEHPKRIERVNAIAETYLLRGQVDQARKHFESIGDTLDSAAVKVGDLLAKEERWPAASEWYSKAFKVGQKPYALYLSGQMLIRAGELDKGQKAVSLATLIPLASESRHDGLASELARRGYTDAAVEQWDLLRRCSIWSEGQMFHAVGALGDAASGKEPLKAAAFWEQRMLNCLQENWYFTDQTSYVRIPHLVHRVRARGLLAQGNASDAVHEVRFCQQIWPGELNVIEECVPLLDSLGRKAEADELFDRAFAAVEGNCRLFPNSAFHHNNLAWVAAKCNRRLDDALAHVQRAVEIAPDSAQYIDTLAEVHFRRGNIDRAIENAKRCIELDPDTDFYKQQLERFEKAKSE